MVDSQNEINNIYLSYNNILNNFKLMNITTANGKEISHKDLVKAIYKMVTKHPTCRWQQKRENGRLNYILIEGYYWLLYVYFQNEKKQIDADIDFFCDRIKQYEELLHLESKNLFCKDVPYLELDSFFNRKERTIQKVLKNIEKRYNKNFIIKGDVDYVSSDGIEILCKNYFKQKYLQILEEYKMELTELYIKADYPYDIVKKIL